MIKKLAKRIAALMLSAMLVVSLTGCDTLDTFYGNLFDYIFLDVLGLDKTQSDSSDYDIPEYTGYDETVFTDLCDQLSELAKGEDIDAIIECFEAILVEFDNLNDQQTLAYIEYCNDITDDDAYDAYTELSTMYSSCANEAYMTFKEILSGPCADEFTDYVSANYIEVINSYEELSDEEMELQEEINNLVDEYFNIYSEFAEQGSYTTEELNEAVGPVYLELIQAYNEEAQYYGYDNFADYADENIYYR